jgi:hypothetical protein
MLELRRDERLLLAFIKAVDALMLAWRVSRQYQQ